MGALLILTHAGLSVRRTSDGALFVAPVASLTDDLRQYIRSHKADLLAELAANDDGADQSTPNHPQARNGSDLTKPDIASVALEQINAPQHRLSVVAARPCGTCHWRRMPGASAPGYCASPGREDLQVVYGLLRRLPRDLGDACNQYQAGKLRWGG